MDYKTVQLSIINSIRSLLFDVKVLGSQAGDSTCNEYCDNAAKEMYQLYHLLGSSRPDKTKEVEDGKSESGE